MHETNKATSPNDDRDFVTRYANFIIRRRWQVIIVVLCASLAFLSGLSKLGFDNSYQVYFSEDNPHLNAFESQQRTYTKNDNVLLSVTPDNGEVFTPDTLSAIEEITREARLLPFILRVDSITNFQHTRADEDSLTVEDLVEYAQHLTPQQLAEAKAIALSEPNLAGQLINADASVTGVNMTFQMPHIALDETSRIADALRALKSSIEAKYPVSIHMSGIVMMSNAFFESSKNDFKTLIPAMYLIIMLALTLLLRSFAATLMTVALIFLSVGVALGVGGLTGIKLTAPSTSAMTIIMTVAVADSIHILVTLFSAMRKGMARHDAIRHSLKLNMSPVLLTSLTTAIGFLSMNFSDVPPFNDLGNLSATGVLWAFVLSITLLPALAAIIPLKPSTKQSKFEVWMPAVGEFVLRRKAAIFATSALISLLFIAAIPLNTFDDNFIAYFDESIEFRTDTDYINKNLTGIYQVQYSLESGEDYGASHPDFLAKVESFSQWLRSQPEVTHVNTITDTIKRLNKSMHADNPEYYRLPDDKALSAQYLLLYELSLPEGLDLNNQLDIGKSATQVIASLKNLPSSKIAEVSERGQQWLFEKQGLESIGVGPTVMFAYISASNMHNMFVGTMVALVLISLLITIALRSLRIGTVSLIPNLLPLAAAFGVWALVNGEVNVAVSMVTGMVLGIVVDDSVHFLSKYLYARRELKQTPEDAIRYAFANVGVAIVMTSIILVAGFTVLGQSSFGMNSNMALISAIAIAMALIADFLLLPVILLYIDRPSSGDKQASP
ncbi:MAG: RND transporter [Alteromonadaceae bacterium]|nr:MAG: RND transporter [Alteromonadaceae bacterium]